MSKKQRGRYGPGGSELSRAPRDPGQSSSTGEPGAPQVGPIRGSSVTTRSARRRGRAAGQQPGFLERYRLLILAGIGVVGVLIILLAISMSGGASAAYACDTLLTPGPLDTLEPATPTPAETPAPSAASSPASAPSPAAGSSPGASASPAASATPIPAPTLRLGFPTADLGRTHVDQGASVDYGFCPPTSGNHWNVPGVAPLPRAFYGPNVTHVPQNWVHNLEHGYVVILYKDTPPQTVLDSINNVVNNAKGSTAAASCGLPNKVIAVRFDSMSTPYALVAWDRALLLPQWDEAQAMTFAEQWQDSPQHPEPGTC